MAERIGCVGEHIVFSSNETPTEDYRLAAKLGAVINLDDLTHVDFLERAIGYIPKKIGCRFNPGGTFSLGETREGFQVMDNPGDAKYGMTRAQIAEAFRLLKAKGAEEFGIHAFLASNTLSNEYYPELARMLFRLAAELQQETGCHITFIDLSGGVGIPYRPDEPANDIAVIGEGVRRAYEEILVPAGMGDVALYTELGRFMLAPYGHLVTRAIHEKHIYKEYIGTDACACDLMRPAMYGSYHHITVMARRTRPATTSTTLSAACVRIMISLPSTGCCRASTLAICLSSMMPVHTALPWATTTTASSAAQRCCCSRTVPRA